MSKYTNDLQNLSHTKWDWKCETLCYVADMTKRSGYPLK